MTPESAAARVTYRAQIGPGRSGLSSAEEAMPDKESKVMPLSVRRRLRRTNCSSTRARSIPMQAYEIRGRCKPGESSVDNIVTVTIIDSGSGAEESARCGWCRRPIDQTVGRGRPKKFCKQSCRQRDYESRERSKAHGLADGELIMTRSELDAMRDNAYVLACAVRDVERDLTEKPTLQDYKDAVQWLIDAAKPLTSSGPLS